jgi:hypothetical protein
LSGFISIYGQTKRKKENFTCTYEIKAGDTESEEIKKTTEELSKTESVSDNDLKLLKKEKDLVI